MKLPGRSTVFRGIQMRSRLEADFARWLTNKSRNSHGDEWIYEPKCFADETGQYLPDFYWTIPGWNHHNYVEVKPASYPESSLAQMFTRMQIIWSSEPDAYLMLVLWEYGQQYNDNHWGAHGDGSRLWSRRHPDGEAGFVVCAIQDGALVKVAPAV